MHGKYDVTVVIVFLADDESQSEELMEEWFGVLRKKKELVDREAKLMLK